MPSVRKSMAAITAALLAVGTGIALASGVSVTAPGRLHAQTLPVVAPTVCWTGSVTFTPNQPFGNPQAYHKITVTGSPGAFSNCIGQFADISINKGGTGTQVDYARSYQLTSNDISGFTALLNKQVLPVPVPAGTTYTLVIHP